MSLNTLQIYNVWHAHTAGSIEKKGEILAIFLQLLQALYFILDYTGRKCKSIPMYTGQIMLKTPLLKNIE